MLVLTRHTQQLDEDQTGDKSVILIGDGIYHPLIESTVTEIRGDQVRMGINAPRDMPVHRTEVYDQIVAETKADYLPQK